VRPMPHVAAPVPLHFSQWSWQQTLWWFDASFPSFTAFYRRESLVWLLRYTDRPRTAEATSHLSDSW
jgi:hypothetical protein